MDLCGRKQTVINYAILSYINVVALCSIKKIKMKTVISTLLLTLSFSIIFAQANLPIGSTIEENSKEAIKSYKDSYSANAKSTIQAQPIGNLRTMAEWEEVQSICITWTGFKSILAEIVREVQSECNVVILCSSATTAQSELTGYGVPITNVTFVEDDYNSIWMRDYGGNTVYKDYVDSLILVDWIYNRSRPDDNSAPEAIGNQLGIPVYEMAQSGTDLVHTGGNFMADGFGTAFSSELVNDENDASGAYNLTVKTSAQVDQLMDDWMGIDTYVKMTVLPYDDIHHIDMHMKLVDEETLVIGEFPVGTSDGPQVELNIQYIQDNFVSVFGTPYKIVRIPMVPSTSGGYPDGSWSGASYRTYANNLIVNNKVLVPTYREEWDTIGLRILRETMPGYDVIGIDCDNSGSNIIGSGGAIHCITKAIGVEDPLLISHQELPNTPDDVNPYTVDALVMHRSGISSATMYYKTSVGGSYTSVGMTNSSGDTWTADIPTQSVGTHVYYYVEGNSVSGKSQVRPMPAPIGYFHFEVTGAVDVIEDAISFGRVFPNPSQGLTCIEISNVDSFNGDLSIYNVLGELVKTIHTGAFAGNSRKYFVNVSDFASGAYNIVLRSSKGIMAMPLMVK
jgi:agmatine deiminase